MREWLAEYLLVAPIYGLMLCLRQLFLSSPTGKVIHNFLFYAVGRLTASQIEHKRKLLAIRGTIFGRNKGFLGWQENVYRSANWQHYLKGTFIRRLIIGSLKRRWLAWRGKTVPSLLFISPNLPAEPDGCNLKCQGCYSGGYRSFGTMPLELFHKIMREQESLGIRFVFITGGEPFMYPRIYEILSGYPKTTFWVATNGTLLDEEKLRRLAGLGNVTLMFGLAGPKPDTDFIRGQDTYDKVMAAMKLAKQLKLVFFVNLTLTRGNFTRAVSRQFLRELINSGCYGINYVCYMPRGQEPHEDWTVTDSQLKTLEELKHDIHEEFPLFLTIGRNGTDKVSNCFAGRQYIHILPDGQAEPCPFASWTDPRFNASTHSITEITNSSLFQIIRRWTGLQVRGLTPCRVQAGAESYAKIAESFAKCGGQPTAARKGGEI